MKTYLVGGAVRDELLNLPIKEKDWVVVGATPEIMLAKHFRPVGKDFPVFLHPETQEEYALARTERKVSRGYTGFEFYTAPDVTLEQDLLRRDLTINAIAKDANGKIIDPYQGRVDLNNRILRHVSPAFAEDPVRILRVARFMAQFGNLNFSIAPETIKLMQTMVINGEVNALVTERVWQEFHKALQTVAPEKFIETLYLCGALKILMPELAELFVTPISPAEINAEIHALMVLQQACKLASNPEVRFAALLYDLDVDSIKLFCNRLKVPNSFKNLALLVGESHNLINQTFRLQPETLLKLFEKTDAFRRPERFQQILLVCVANFRDQPGNEFLDFRQTIYLTSILKAASSIDIKSLVTAGFTGEALINEIRKHRIKAIQEISIN